MKRTSLAAFVLTLSAASISMAQPPGGGRGGRGQEGGAGVGGANTSSMVERMMAFDKNEDGKVSKDEVPERLQSMFTRADKDEDGYLSKDEITTEVGSRGGEGGPGGRGGFPGGSEGGGRGGFPGGSEGGGRGGFAGGQPGGPNPVIAALDANGDGELSSEEIDLAIVSLKKLDKNKDGKLDRSELGPSGPQAGGDRRQGGGGPGMGGPGGGGNMAEFMLNRFDADKDGKLTGDEIPERMRENLSSVDSNKDGSIDKEELNAMGSRIQGGGGAGGRGFGGGRPGGEGAGREGGRPSGEGAGREGGGGERRRPPTDN